MENYSGHECLTVIKSKSTFSISARGRVQRYEWVNGVTKLPKKDRKFSPSKEGKFWVIRLCPSFENRKDRRSKDIPSEAQGIYRYLRQNNEIVYIGRGAIKSRLADPERKEWDFDRVEYSLVQDPDQQIKWEDHWIERFKEENGGKRPF